MSIGLYIDLAPLYLKYAEKLQEKRFDFIKSLASIIPENVVKVSKIKCFKPNQQTLIKFINEILLNEDNNRVQGIITTHSSEIVKCSELKNIRVLRIDELLKSSIYDMNLFKQNLDTEEERQFFSFLFSINYSDLIFANKVIMYEGDTEKLYIEKILSLDEFEGLSNQYISFVQVGGAYTHWYRKLVYFLKIKTLIITDIDYHKMLTSIDKIKKDDGITNAGLIQYYKDYITSNITRLYNFINDTLVAESTVLGH